MRSAQALKKTEEQTRNWRTDGREASVVALPRRGRNGTFVDEPIVDEVLRPRGLEERAVGAVATMLRYDEQLTRLRRSQDSHAANIKDRLDTLGDNGKKMHLRLNRHEQRLNVHRTVLLRLGQELMATDGMCVQNQEDLARVDEEVSRHGLALDRANLRIDMERDNNYLHRAWLESHEAHIRNIEQALTTPRPTTPFLSGLNWKLAGAWTCAIVGAGMIAAHFLHLL